MGPRKLSPYTNSRYRVAVDAYAAHARFLAERRRRTEYQPMLTE
jgi:hypothetical protein